MRRLRISPLPDPIAVAVPIPAERLRDWEEEDESNVGGDDECAN
jgi:hypothetical protein